MATPFEHEKEFIDHFIAPVKRPRYRELLRNHRGRTRIENDLPHRFPMDTRYAIPVRGTFNEGMVVEYLLKRGAPDECYVFAASHDPHGFYPLEYIVEQCFPYGCGAISCVPGRLGLYLGEMDRYFLVRDGT